MFLLPSLRRGADVRYPVLIASWTNVANRLADCKTLAPIWETLANDFVNEPSVLIAKVDAEAENAKALATEQGVSSYPTIKFFKKGSTEPVMYEGGRSEDAFVQYLNTNSGTHRAVGGGLDATGGTIEAFETVISKFQSAYGDGVEEALFVAAELQVN